MVDLQEYKKFLLSAEVSPLGTNWGRNVHQSIEFRDRGGKGKRKKPYKSRFFGLNSYVIMGYAFPHTVHVECVVLMSRVEK